MKDVVVYDSADKKQFLDAKYAPELSPISRLCLYLDWMDLYRKFGLRACSDQTEDDGIEWIILEIENKKDS